MSTVPLQGGSEAPSLKRPRVRPLFVAIVFYFAFSLPYGITKLSGDEVHFATVPYLILGGDYTLSALKEGEYRRALLIAWQSYSLAWRYYVRPADAGEHAASELNQYEATFRATKEHQRPFVFTEDYFVTHRKTGKPLLSFLLNAPALALSMLLPHNLIHYQREYIYHPAFLLPRLVSWLLGLGCILLIYRFVRERWDPAKAGRAALIFAVLPVTMLWSPDLHQDIPLAFLILLFGYYWGRGQVLRAAVVWGLAFAVKNQAVFALLPLGAEAIWLACDAGSPKERWARAWLPLRDFLFIFAVGLVVSTPFGHPLANLKEVAQTSEAGFDQQIQNISYLFFNNPIWCGMGLLALLGLSYLDEVRDRFDRYWIFFLILPAFLSFYTNSRVYMLLPAAAILAGSYFRPKTAYFAVAGLIIIGFWGLPSPYLTIRGVGYRDLLRDYPITIGDIEKLRGVGSVRAEEEYSAERERRKRRGLPEQDPEAPRNKEH